MEKSSTQAKKRILSLDLFRGMTVAGMILVNNPGSWSAIYSPLKHAKWNGCTPTDLVFPFFLFAVGASISISLYSKNEMSRSGIWSKISVRSLVLIGLGLFLNFFGEWSFAELRIPGVLQRIGFVYFAVASLYLIVPGKKSLIALIPILIVPTWILLNVAPPGESAVSLEPGKDIGSWLDRILFGESHLWKFSKTWDPEGFFSGIMSIASSLFGVLCGLILSVQETSRNKRTAALFGIGALLTLAGLIWNESLPMNKSLWTASYAVYTAGLAFFSVSFFEFLSLLFSSDRSESDQNVLEILFQPFLVFGKNAILVFVASGIVARILNLWTTIGENGKAISVKTWIYLRLIGLLSDSYFASLSYALLNLIVWWLILSYLDRKKIYFKV
ncbi:acyltransferase family protein [Leptospira yasudae]|uniref:DUF5009 domain-containing protein n=1 Tax=Leptospira yasudae TaxID=2202201 RepID=A0ABX9M1Y8_9LEPT|nr:DUF5009 domain-containing protein [Leptospira yasudae]RHX79519.1 DUF5009 domain-containing protein [Leptospira yasudae]